MWIGGGAQFVPGQDAISDLSVSVPMIPPSWGAWEISPAEVRSIRPERILGATRVTLHDFSLTGAVLFTGDLGGQVVRLQNQQRRMAPTAAQWSHDQAAEELAKVEKIHGELEQAGHKLPDAAELLAEGPRLRCRRAPTCGSRESTKRPTKSRRPRCGRCAS